MADKVVPMDVRSMVINWPAEVPHGAVARFCREQHVSRSWFYELRRRAREESALEALQPRPRRRVEPHPQAVPAHLEELAVRIRKELAGDGWDCGAITVRHKLLEQGLAAPAASTLHRIFVRRGMVVAQPQKRPHAADRRFEASLVDEMWQLDSYQWSLATEQGCAIFNLLDDCSRTLISRAAVAETAEAALEVTQLGIDRWQVPCMLLSDNGAALNPTRRGRRGRLATFLKQQGCRPITGRPDHPQTQGKDERVHQTQQRWLRARPRPQSLAELQTLLDHFDDHYNNFRPHQALGMLTPTQARATRPQAAPPLPSQTPPVVSPAVPCDPTPARVRTHKVSSNGNLGLSIDHTAVSIRLDPEHHGARVSVLISSHTVTIFDAGGHQIRTVVLEPGRRYYSNGRPRGRPGHRNRPD
jgi:transposase InsO family protein